MNECWIKKQIKEVGDKVKNDNVDMVHASAILYVNEMNAKQSNAMQCQMMVLLYNIQSLNDTKLVLKDDLQGLLVL